MLSQATVETAQIAATLVLIVVAIVRLEKNSTSLKKFYDWIKKISKIHKKIREKESKMSNQINNLQANASERHISQIPNKQKKEIAYWDN